MGTLDWKKYREALSQKTKEEILDCLVEEAKIRDAAEQTLWDNGYRQTSSGKWVANPEDKIFVSVSGSSVYRAVLNYFKNGENLPAALERAVQKMLKDELFLVQIKQQVLTHLRAEIDSSEIRQTMRNAIRQEIDKTLVKTAKTKAFEALEKKLEELSKEDLLKMLVK